MKKLLKKALALTVALVTVATCAFGLTACGGSKTEPNTIYVSVINKGYGNKWIDSLMKEFLNSDAKYANYKYDIVNSYDDDTTKTQVESGAAHCNYDLVFHAGGSNNIETEYLADLSSVYGMSYANGKLSDYMEDTVLALFKRGEKYYNIPWTSGGSGILVNYEVVSSKLGTNWQETYHCRTTEEFMTFIDALAQNGVTPFVITPNDHFYHPLYETWWAQYEGLTGVEDYYNARYTDVNGDVQEGPEAFLQPGILQSLKVMEEIFKNESNYTVYGTSTAMETAYMQGKGAMIVNGSWMKNEQVDKNGYKAIDMRFIQTPVISALGVKLGLSTAQEVKGEGGQADINYNITDESKFIEVINYVDAVLNGETASKPSGVQDSVIEEVMQARRMVYTELDYSNACVPAYCDDKDVAIEFLKWMYSEVGQRQYAKAMNGLVLPVQGSVAEDSSLQTDDFTASHKSLTKNMIIFEAINEWKFAKTSLVPFTARNKQKIEYLLSGKSGAQDLDTAWELYNFNKTHYEEGNNWNLLLNAAK